MGHCPSPNVLKSNAYTLKHSTRLNSKIRHIGFSVDEAPQPKLPECKSSAHAYMYFSKYIGYRLGQKQDCRLVWALHMWAWFTFFFFCYFGNFFQLKNIGHRALLQVKFVCFCSTIVSQVRVTFCLCDKQQQSHP